MEMDADLSHDPTYLPLLIEESRRFDFVIGSRYIQGGGVVDWGMLRKARFQGGIAFSRIVLGSGICDLTGGFNAWNRTVFQKVDLAEILSTGYCFQIELKYRAASERLLLGRGPHTLQGQEARPVEDVRRDRAGGGKERSCPAAEGRAWLSS